MSRTAKQRAGAIAIAQDVLKQLRRRTHRLKPAKGHYLRAELPCGTELVSGDFQAHVDVVQAHCTPCALGSLLLSQVRVFDAVPLPTVYESTRCGRVIEMTRREIVNNLDEFFDHATLQLIEHLFEDWSSSCHDARTVRQHAEFIAAHPTPRKRLIAMMKNIVAHGGDLVLD